MPVPNHADPRREIITVIRDFSKKVSKHIAGLPPPSVSSATRPTDGLIHQLNGAYERFRMAVHQTAPRFRPWMSSSYPQNVDNMCAAAGYDDPAGTGGPIFYLDEVMDLAKRYVELGSSPV